MDGLHHPKSASRIIVHHARFIHPITPAPSSEALDGAGNVTIRSIPSQTASRRSKEVWQRTIDEHPMNQSVDIFLPTVSPTLPVALADPISSFISFVSPLFFYSGTLPFSVLLSDDFLARYIARGDCLMRTIRTPIDHCCAAQLTGTLLRLYLDTAAFEELGLEAEHAHSEFDVCSQTGAAKPKIRERCVSIDLKEFATRALKVKEMEEKQANGQHVSKDNTKDDSTTAISIPPTSKRLQRLRWCLSRVAGPSVHIMYVNEHGTCDAINLPPTSGAQLERVYIKPVAQRLDAKPGNGGEERSSAHVPIPDLSELSKLISPSQPTLPSSIAPNDEVAEVEDAKPSRSKQQKRSHPATAASASGSATAASSSSVTPVAPLPTPAASVPTNHFPYLSDGTRCDHVIGDLLTYFGLLRCGLGGSGLIGSTNNLNGTQSQSHSFMSQPLCPYLQFLQTITEADDDAHDGEGESQAEECMDQGEDVAGEDDGIISLAAYSSQPKRHRATGGKKRRRDISASPASSSSSRPFSSMSTVCWRGLLPSSFLCQLLLAARSLLATDPRLPFIAMHVTGFDDNITSWRGKQHQIWMGGAGSEAGGGENHYTIILLRDSEDATHDAKSMQRPFATSHSQQYIICLQLGDLDRTH